MNNIKLGRALDAMIPIVAEVIYIFLKNIIFSSFFFLVRSRKKGEKIKWIMFRFPSKFMKLSHYFVPLREIVRSQISTKIK